MMYARFHLATGNWDGQPVDNDAHDPELEGVRAIPAGWPTLYAWSPALPGFVPVARELTAMAYQRLFTQAERIALRASTDPVVVDYRELIGLAALVNLTDPDVIAGAGYFAQAGLIAPERVPQILSGTPPVSTE